MAFLDRFVFGYIVAYCICLTIFGRGTAGWQANLLTNLVILGVIAAMLRYWRDRTTGLPGFLRQMYPGLLYPLFYGQMQGAIHWIIPEFLDGQLVALEQAIFGVDLNVWLQNIEHPLVNEWLMLGYFSYYLLIPIVVLPLHFRGRTREARGVLTATTVAFVISYIGFVVYPVEGPRYFLADQINGPLSGYLFVPLVNWIISGAAIHGGCMPSSHTAVALCVLVWARRTQPILARWLAPLVFTLMIGTVWGRFHYLTDMIVGIGVGWAGLYLGERWGAADLAGDPAKKAEVAATQSSVLVGNEG